MEVSVGEIFISQLIAIILIFIINLRYFLNFHLFLGFGWCLGEEFMCVCARVCMHLCWSEDMVNKYARKSHKVCMCVWQPCLT